MYVPPSRRAGYTPPSSATLPPDYKPRSARKPSAELHTALQLTQHFTHLLNATINTFSRPPPPHTGHPRLKYDPSRVPEAYPLPPSPPPPSPPHPLRHLTSYIVIFRNAHPDWESAGELWTHTNAKVLIEDYGTDEQPGRRRNFGRPIPVFEGVRSSQENLKFAGWHQIDKLRVVPRRSEELKELLQRKEVARSYTRSGRSASAWATSLSQQWIKVRLSPCPSSSEHYTSLEDPMKLRGGEGGEVERYLLKVGGLEEELATLERDEVPVESI